MHVKLKSRSVQTHSGHKVKVSVPAFFVWQYTYLAEAFFTVGCLLLIGGLTIQGLLPSWLGLSIVLVFYGFAAAVMFAISRHSNELSTALERLIPILQKTLTSNMHIAVVGTPLKFPGMVKLGLSLLFLPRYWIGSYLKGLISKENGYFLKLGNRVVLESSFRTCWKDQRAWLYATLAHELGHASQVADRHDYRTYYPAPAQNMSELDADLYSYQFLVGNRLMGVDDTLTALSVSRKDLYFNATPSYLNAVVGVKALLDAREVLLSEENVDTLAIPQLVKMYCNWIEANRVDFVVLLKAVDAFNKHGVDFKDSLPRKFRSWLIY